MRSWCYLSRSRRSRNPRICESVGSSSLLVKNDPVMDELLLETILGLPLGVVCSVRWGLSLSGCLLLICIIFSLAEAGSSESAASVAWRGRVLEYYSCLRKEVGLCLADSEIWKRGLFIFELRLDFMTLIDFMNNYLRSPPQSQTHLARLKLLAFLLQAHSPPPL